MSEQEHLFHRTTINPQTVNYFFGILFTDWSQSSWSLTQGTGLQRAPPRWACWPGPHPQPWGAWWPDGASSPADTSRVWVRCTSWAGWWCAGRCAGNRAWLRPWHLPWSWPGSWSKTRHIWSLKTFAFESIKCWECRQHIYRHVAKTFLVSDMPLLFGVFILNTEWTSQILSPRIKPQLSTLPWPHSHAKLENVECTWFTHQSGRCSVSGMRWRVIQC